MIVHDDGPLSALLDTAKFEHIQRIAKAFAASSMVPDACRGNLANCFVLTQLAIRLGVDPFMLMQNCYVVAGRPGIEAKLAIALCNQRGPFADRIKFHLEGEGMGRSCTAYAHDAKTGERLEQTVTMRMAKAEGWIDKKGSKWQTLPDLMLQYRAAMFLIRLNCPEVLMGLDSREELEDRVIDVPSAPTLAQLESRLRANGPTPSAHQQVEDLAAAEVAAGPSGTTPEVGDQAEAAGVAEEATECPDCGRLLSPGEPCPACRPAEAVADPVLVGEYREALAAATKQSEVSALLSQAAACNMPTRVEVERLAAEARERIRGKDRAGRGERSNKRGLLGEE